MKENVLEVLMYLFENYIYEQPAAADDRHSMEESLHQAGFTNVEIDKAFRWLDVLAEQRDSSAAVVSNNQPMRVYTADELDRLDADCRGFLLYLENTAVLDTHCRELVLDRLQALENEDIDLEDVKWVVLMVLFNQPGQEANFASMEDLMFDNEGEYLH
ncbi:MAG: DUF494 family protein [Xanthomonadales bacterium]|nr:DUF494 family protein [Xanthomonadales bacterium]